MEMKRTARFCGWCGAVLINFALLVPIWARWRDAAAPLPPVEMTAIFLCALVGLFVGAANERSWLFASSTAVGIVLNLITLGMAI